MFITLAIVFIPFVLLLLSYTLKSLFQHKNEEFFPLLEMDGEKIEKRFLRELKHWDGRVPIWVEQSCSDEDYYY